MSRLLRWVPAVLGLGWLAVQVGLEAAGVYSYWLRAPWLQALVVLVLMVAVLLGDWRTRRRFAWLLAVPGLLWAGWEGVQMVGAAGWTEGTLSFGPALLLLSLAEVVRHVPLWRPRRRR